MKSTLILLCLCAWLSVEAPQRKGWRGIVPLHSTRADVERLIGKPNFQYSLYEFEDERVRITYSAETCAEGAQWNAPRDIVTQVSVAPKGKLRLSDLRLDPRKYERVEDTGVDVHTFYINEEEGIRYVVFEGGGEDHGLVLNVYYEPAAEDHRLRCPARDGQPAPSGRSGAGGPAGDSPRGDPCPSIKIVQPAGGPRHCQRLSLGAHLSGLDPRFEPTYKWEVSAGTILSGQGTGSIEVDASGAGGKPLTVSVVIGGVIPGGCPTTESYTFRCDRR